MPVLGKPLNYNRGSKRDARYRKLQSRVYNFLERPRGLTAILYHIMVFLMVFTCLALSVFSTIEEYEKDALYILFRMELLVVVWFTFEFFARLWSSGCRSRYQGCIGRLKFLKRPFCIVDMITIVASIVVLGMGASGQVFATSALRGLRFFQILRMVRMDRRGGTWKLLGSVVYAHRQELFTTMYIGFLGLIFASFLVYLMEKDVNVKFSNFAQALWWGVITLCTVGYGDMVPETWQGKLIASFCALLGISFFALPAGILGSGFALKVQQQQRQKHMIRRRQPAATLIQSLWRCYAADENSISTATWKMHQVILPSPPASSEYWDRMFKSLIDFRRTSSSFKHNASFVARLPTIRKHKSQFMAPPPPAPASAPPPPPSNGGGSGAGTGGSGIGIGGSGSGSGSGCGPGSSGGGDGFNFKSALSLNRTTASTTASTTRYTTRTLREMNQSVENLEVVPNGRSLNPSFSEDSVADTTFLKAKNSDDEDEEPHCTQLTNQHKTAIRFIRKLKYFVARRKFKEALKPYDVKDVMEQYAAGHVDLLGRVKNVHARLDQILGKQGSKSKDAYASKVSLASRIVKVERQVADIEEKLDMFIKTYMDDRQQLRMSDYSFQVSRHSKNNRLQQQQHKQQQFLKKDLFTKSIEIQEGPLNEQNILTTDSLDTTESSPNITGKIFSDFKKSSDKIGCAITSKPDIQYFTNDFLTDIDGKNLKKVLDSRSTFHQWQSKDINRRDVSIAIPDLKSNDGVVTNREQQRTDSSIIMVDDYPDLEGADNNDNNNCDQRERKELKSCYTTWDVESGAATGAIAAAANDTDRSRNNNEDDVEDGDGDGDGDGDVDGDDNTAENTALLNQISVTLTPTTTTVNHGNSLHSLQDSDGLNASVSWLTPKSG